MPLSDRIPEGWHARQRTVIIGFLILLTSFTAWQFWRRPAIIDDPILNDPPRATEIADRIDPNSADLATLSALPSLGEKRARAIIEFRERIHARTPGATAFQTSYDLLKIKGIGTAMLANLKPYLVFPHERPATTQSLLVPISPDDPSPRLDINKERKP